MGGLWGRLISCLYYFIAAYLSNPQFLHRFFSSYKRVIHLPTGPSYHGSVWLIYIFNIGLGFLALLCLHATHYIILIYIYHGSVLEWLYSLLALLFYIDPIILHASMGFDLV